MSAQHSYKLRYENGDGWVAFIYRGEKLVTRLEYFDRGREAGDAARDWIDAKTEEGNRYA